MSNRILYVDSVNGNDANSGLSWGLAKKTLNGVEDLPVVAGDIVYCSGTFRETLTVDVSGGNLYTTGTVSVTQGSTTVTGSGTSFLANTFADGQFRVNSLASGTDGVTVLGGNTFTSATGNFQSGHIGMTIRINTVGAYVILAVAGLTSITVKNIDGTTPVFAAASGLTYDVGPEGAYEIKSITNDTRLELVRPWGAPSFTGLNYQCWRDIKYIGTCIGPNGLLEQARITGSDNDQTAVRLSCISSSSKTYRTFRGFSIDTSSDYVMVSAAGAVGWVLEDIVSNGGGSITFSAVSSIITIRRVFGFGGMSYILAFTNTTTQNNSGILIENVQVINARTRGVNVTRVGGITIKNCSILANTGIRIDTALAVGQAVTVNNCIFYNCGVAIQCTTANEMLENYNTFYINSTDRTTVGTGANSLTYPPLFLSPMLYQGFKLPFNFGELQSSSAIRYLTGLQESADGYYGIDRPTTSSKKSWGAVQYNTAIRDTGTIHSGTVSLELTDSARHQITVPSSSLSTTVTVWVYREANYSGTNPQVIIKQPGVTDIIVTDALSAGQWNQLRSTFTPSSTPGFITIELVSNNTAIAGSYAVYFDDLLISYAPLGGQMENWVRDGSPLNIPAQQTITRSRTV